MVRRDESRFCIFARGFPVLDGGSVVVTPLKGSVILTITSRLAPYYRGELNDQGNFPILYRLQLSAVRNDCPFCVTTPRVKIRKERGVDRHIPINIGEQIGAPCRPPLGHGVPMEKKNCQ